MYVYMLHPDSGKELLWFSPNYGGTVRAALLEEPEDRIKRLLQTAFEYNSNQHLVDCCQGARGPLMERFGFMTPVNFSDFLTALENIRVEEETKRAKRRITKQRRAEFQRERALIALRMIDLGIPYVCAWEGCAITEDLTIDHVEPLSRGGSDEITNLQFMCVAHNSHKGDRRVAEAAA